MTKWERELAKIAKGLGVERVHVELTNNNHLCVTGEYQGRPIRTIAALTGSDIRQHHHVRANIRRQMRAQP